MWLGGEQQQVIRAKLEHAALEHGVQARLGVLRGSQGMEQRLHHAHLGRRGEGRAAHNHALKATLAKGGDVGIGLVEAAHEHGHATRGHAALANGSQAVCELSGSHGNAKLLSHGLALELVGASELNHHAWARILRKIALAARFWVQVHEVRHNARVTAGTRHKAQDGVVASEVEVEPHGVVLAHRLTMFLEHAHVCAAEAVDGLLGVSHRGEVASTLAREALDHAHLLGIGVLELVDHHQAELVRVLGRNLGVLAEGTGQKLQQVVVVEHATLGLCLAIELLHVGGQAHEGLLQALDACHGAARLCLRQGTLGLVRELLHGLGAPLGTVGSFEGIQDVAGCLGTALAGGELKVALHNRKLAAKAFELVLVLGVAGTQCLVGKLKSRHGTIHVLLGRHKLERLETHEGTRRLVGNLRNKPEHAFPGATVAGAVLGIEGVKARVTFKVGKGLLRSPAAQQVGVLVANHLEIRVEAKVERMGAQDAAAHVVDGAHPG